MIFTSWRNSLRCTLSARHNQQKTMCKKQYTKKNKFQVLQSGLFFCNKTVVILTCFIFLASITVVRGAVFVSIILQCHAVTTDWQNLRRPRCCRTIATLEKICNGFWIPENIRFTVNVDARVLQKV